MLYTIKCNRNGKFISSLFSDSLEDTFSANTASAAYVWNNLEFVMELCDEINTTYEHDFLCSIVRVYE